MRTATGSSTWPSQRQDVHAKIQLAAGCHPSQPGTHLLGGGTALGGVPRTRLLVSGALVAAQLAQHFPQCFTVGLRCQASAGRGGAMASRGVCPAWLALRPRARWPQTQHSARLLGAVLGKPGALPGRCTLRLLLPLLAPLLCTPTACRPPLQRQDRCSICTWRQGGREETGGCRHACTSTHRPANTAHACSRKEGNHCKARLRHDTNNCLAPTWPLLHTAGGLRAPRRLDLQRKHGRLGGPGDRPVAPTRICLAAPNSRAQRGCLKASSHQGDVLPEKACVTFNHTCLGRSWCTRGGGGPWRLPLSGGGANGSNSRLQSHGPNNWDI